MKKLIILRHGKSSWDDPLLKDFERPLNIKGKKRTIVIADYLKDKNIKPELIITSPAKRTKDTASIIVNNLNIDKSKLTENADLYFVDVEKYFETIFSTSNKINNLMLIGHNPMITDFCNYFLEEKINNLPTSGLCIIDFSTDKWEEISKSKYKLQHLIFPKKLIKNEELSE
jgi:phosphohistidine phosphatase